MTQSAEPGRWTDVISAAAILLLGFLLYAAGFGIVEQWQESSAKYQGLQAEHLLGAAAAAAGAALMSWWFLGLLFAAATTLLDQNGKTRAAAVTRRLSPALMQRLVLAALSIQLITAPAANAHTALSGPEWIPTLDHVASAPASAGSHKNQGLEPTPAVEDATAKASVGSTEPSAQPVAASPEEQTNAASPPRAEHNRAEPAPVSREEGPENGAAPRSEITPGWQPAAPITGPGLLAAPAVRAADDAHVGAVTVLAGDTLWDVAAHAMGTDASDVDIATQWPRWYEANRSIIGPNPDVLLPGQILQPPSPA
jgi:hypothetical protein